MSLMLTTPFGETPQEFVDYAQSHASQGTTINIFRMEDEEGFHFVATGEDSDFTVLRDMGYELKEVYAAGSQPLYDNPVRFMHSDDRCC